MKAIITCAGYASRLWPLTKETPKPLLHVKDRAIVHHIIDKLTEIEAVDGIYIVVNEKFAQHFEDWLAENSFSVPVKVINDGTTSNDNRLGQVGDIKFVLDKEKIDDDIIIVAGDNLFNFSLLPIYDLFKKNSSVVNGIWESNDIKAAQESGTVVLDKETSAFVEFMEKAKNPKTTLLSLGIYLFPRSKLSHISTFVDEGNNADKMGYFITWLMQHETVYGQVYEDKWFDIGWIEALEQARREFQA